jgi:hypothetical protein
MCRRRRGPPGRTQALLPGTDPAVLVMVKLLERALRNPAAPVVKLPDSVKVPGKGPAAAPLTEKRKLPASVPTLQVPVSVDP